MSEAIAPNLKNRAATIAAHLEVPPPGDRRDDLDGVVVAHGAHSGGYGLYVRDRRLHYTYNFVGTTVTTVSSEVDLPEGTVEVRVQLTPGFGSAEVELFYGDVPVGRGSVPKVTPVTYGMTYFTVGYQPGSPVDPKTVGRAAMDERVLKRVVIEIQPSRREAAPEPDRTHVDLATQ
jgi:arylsulfatase